MSDYVLKENQSVKEDIDKVEIELKDVVTNTIIVTAEEIKIKIEKLNEKLQYVTAEKTRLECILSEIYKEVEKYKLKKGKIV